MAVQRAIASGRITPAAGGKIDPKRAEREWRANTDQSNPRNRFTGNPKGTRLEEPEAGVGSGFTRVRTVREYYHAQMAKLELEQQQGILVRADEVRLGAFNQARKTRDQLVTLPERLVTILAAISDSAEVQKILEDEVERICQELSDAQRS